MASYVPFLFIMKEMESDLLSETRALLNAGLNEKALDLLNLHLSQAPKDCDAYYWRSVVKARLQDRSGAMNDLYQALEIEPLHKQANAALELHRRIMSFYSKDLLNP